MKPTFLILAFLLASQFANGQWVKQTANTTASFRGLSVVDEKVIWASGTEGTVIRTIDGGQHWNVIKVPDADKLDFRDIEAFDANTAYILSIGNGESSRIYKTIDGGKSWNLQFKNTNEKAFFDAIACWDRNTCVAMSDPVDSKFVLIKTINGGSKWEPMNTDTMPVAKDGEASFAASGTCLIIHGKNNLFLVTGGSDARVFKSIDRGRSWVVYGTPLTKGSAGSGIFSIAMFDDINGVIVGGNYEKVDEVTDSFASTTDGGKTWSLETGLGGYRSGVAYIKRKTLVAVGPTGADVLKEHKPIWGSTREENFNAVQSKGPNAVWAVGTRGSISQYIGMMTITLQ